MDDELYDAANEAAAAIIDGMIKLNKQGMREDALVLGALFAGIDIAGGDDNYFGVPDPLFVQMNAWRHRREHAPVRRDQ